MAYDLKTAERIRNYLSQFTKLKIEEKKMFHGLTFMINGKMCINVSGNNLMCRFDPGIQDTVEKKNNVIPMIMKGTKYKGYCYIEPPGFKTKKDLEYWINLCLDFNEKAKSSKK